MKPAGPVIEIYARPRHETWPRVEKASMSGRLDNPPRDAEGVRKLNMRTKSASEPCLSGTHSASSPLATGVPAGFIAQVIGQTLSTSRANAKARMRAYAEAELDPAEMRLVRWA